MAKKTIIAKKTNSIKHLLATASAVAVFTTGATSAWGNERTTAANVVVMQGPVGMGSFNDDDAILIHADNVAVSVGGAPHAVSAFDLANHTGVTLDVNHNLSLGSVAKNGNNPGSIAVSLGVTVQTSKTLTLTGKDNNSTTGVAADNYAGLGDVILTGTGEVVVNSAVAASVNTFNGKFNGSAANNGSIAVTTAAVFKGAIGDQAKIDHINVTAAVAAKFHADVGTLNIAGTNAGIKLSNVASEMHVMNGAVVHSDVISNGAAGKGVVVFDGSAAGGVGGKIIGDIGTSAASVASIKVNNGIQHFTTAEVAGSIYAANGLTFYSAHDKLKISAGAAVDGSSRKLAAAVISNGAAGNGILEFEGNGQINARVGNGGEISKLIINNGVVFSNTDVIKASNIELAHLDATLSFGNSATVITGPIKNTVVGGAPSGKIIVGAGGNNALTVVGEIGAANAPLREIAFNVNDQTLESKGAGIWVSEFTQNKGFGVGNAQGALSIYGAAGAGNGGFALVGSTSTQGGDYYLTGIKVNENADNTAETKVSMSGNIKLSTEVELVNGQASTWKMENGSSLTGDFKFRNPDHVLEFGDNTNLTGKIYAGADGDGKIKVSGNATVTHVVGKAIIGDSGTPLRINEIDFATASTLTVNNNGNASEIATANGIKFTADGTLKLAGDQSHTINSGVIIPTNNTNAGTIEIDNTVASGKTVTLNGAIGDETNGKRLKLLKLDSTGQGNNALTVNLAGGNAAIKTIEVAGEDTKIQLSEANGQYYTGGINTGGQGDAKLVLQVMEDLTLKTDVLAANVDLADLLAGDRLKAVAIENNKTLTLADGAVLIAEEMVKVGNNNIGTLLFKGDAVFAATSGDGIALAELQIQSAALNKTVKLLTDTRVTGDISLSHAGGVASTLEFFGNKLEATSITGQAGSTLKLNTLAENTDLQTVNVAVGGNVTVEFNANRDVTFAKPSASTSYRFKNTDDIIVDLGQSIVGGANFVVSDSADDHVTVKVKDGSILSGNLGTDKVVSFESAGDLTITSISAAAAKAKFFTSGNDKSLTLNTADAGADQMATISSIGRSSDDTIFKVVNFNKNYTVSDDVEAKNFNVGRDKKVIFQGNVVGETIKLADAGSKVEFNKDGLILDLQIQNESNAAGGQGEVRFGNISMELNEAIGAADLRRLAHVEFAADAANANRAEWKTTRLGADIHATVIDFHKQNVSLKENLVLDGGVNFAGSSLHLADHTLTSKGGTAAFSGAIEISADYLGSSSGTIVNDKGTALTFAAGSSLELAVEDKTGRIAREDASITIIQNKGTAFDNTTLEILSSLTDVKVIGPNDLVQWIPNVVDGNLVLVRENIAGQKIAEQIMSALGTAQSEAERGNISIFEEAPVGSAAASLYDSLVNMKDAKRVETIQRISRESATALATSQVVENASSVVSGRLFGATVPVSNLGDVIGGDLNVPAPDMLVGVAAGDDYDRFGLWASPFISKGTQKARKGATGYNTDGYGLTAGFDVKANDDLVVGGAITFASTTVEHKDAKKGDKTKIGSFLFSVYGLQQLTTNWFLQGSATAGNNTVTNKSKRVVSDSAYEIAKGKYDSMLMSGELMAGYNANLGAMTATPMLGANFTRSNDAGYRETGTTNQNLDINKKAANKFEVVAGLRLSALAYNMDGVTMSPEIHGFVRHDLVGKNPKVDVKIDGANRPLEQGSVKPVKTSFNVGAGLNSTYGNMEYGATYDAHISDKYIGHQGTLKMRINF